MTKMRKAATAAPNNNNNNNRIASAIVTDSNSNVIECPICGEISEQPYLNYGAKACYSCRAFFRRAHQKTKSPRFTCKKAPIGCEVTVKTRRQCQKCRYDKCIKAGMRPEFVMSEDQKKARFKNVSNHPHNTGSRPRPEHHEMIPISLRDEWKDVLMDTTSSSTTSSAASSSSPPLAKTDLSPGVTTILESRDEPVLSSIQKNPQAMTASVMNLDNDDLPQTDLDILNLDTSWNLPPDSLNMEFLNTTCLPDDPQKQQQEQLLQMINDMDYFEMVNHVPRELETSFEELQDICHEEQMNKVRTVYLDVSLGEDFLKEFVMFAYDVPLSKHFVPQVTATNAERYRRVLNVFDEFNSLKDCEKYRLVEQNVYKAVALNIAKICNCKTGKCQLNFIVGKLDDEIFGKLFAGVVDVSKLKKIKMQEINAQTNIFNQETLLKYMTLVQRLQFVANDPEVYELLTLIALFSGEISEENRQVALVQRRYTELLHRRLKKRLGNQCSAQKELAKISSTMGDVLQLSQILQGMSVS